MSGICGIVTLDGSEPSAAQIAAMTALLERRGPDGTHHWQCGNIALGHTLLATTPEAIHETLPLTEPQSGCTITADVRLDNRDELFETLGLDPAGRRVGDGELILRAYLKWGENCPKHLLGDFAFAIWDSRKGRLFCARDHMGMRQLIYCHVLGKVLAFATEPRAVLTHPDVPAGINKGRIADFLEGYLEGADFTSTFFQELQRLPPAHCLTSDAQGLRTNRYWTLAPGAPLELDSDEDYAAGFLEVLTQAVSCRLRSVKPIGAMMSGGLDSNSVVAIARQLLSNTGSGPLKTFSAIGPDPETCEETRTIQIASAVSDIEPHFVNFTKLDFLEPELHSLTRNCDDPFDGNMVLPRAIYLVAHKANVNVVLDGVSADVVLNAANRISQLARQGRWQDAWREARGESRFWGPEWSHTRAFFLGTRNAIVPNWLRGIKATCRQVFAAKPSGKLLNRALARRLGLPGRVAVYRSQSSPFRRSALEERAQTIRQPYLTAARERYDRVASAVAIEPRDPFLDLRVIEFCLRLPESQLQSAGWPKTILRRSLAGLLSDDIRWRRGKSHIGWKFIAALSEDTSRELSNFGPRTSLFAGQSGSLMTELSRHWSNAALSNEEKFEAWALRCWLDRHGVSDRLNFSPSSIGSVEQ